MKGTEFRILPIGDEVVELISMSDYYVHPIGVDYKEVETHIEDVIEPPVTKEQELGLLDIF